MRIISVRYRLESYTDAMSTSLRRICSGCKQELSRSAYYRHQNYPASCPMARVSTNEPERVAVEEVNENIHVDSAVSAAASSCEVQPSDQSGFEVYEDDVSSDSGADANEDDETEVVMNVPTDDSNEEQIAVDDGPNAILKAISFFLLFFQLKFRVPDRAVTFLLSFLKGLLASLIFMIPSCQPLLEIYRNFPQSLYSLRRRFSTNNGNMKEFVVCTKCFTLYKLDDCSVKDGSEVVSRKCSFIEFPNHPQRHRRTPCGALLLKKIKCGTTFKLVPKKTFIYNSVTTALRSILGRPGMLKQCNEWRRFVMPDGDLSDIMDGRLWKDFRFVSNRPFLDAPNNVGLALNIDWFNPFEHTQYSIGAIYLTILNLPREERYNIENTVLVGLMPGPTEPKRISPFLDPLIDELLQLWEGVPLSTETPNSSLTLRAALLCFISDIPATRKVCGFPGFKARLGCSKCLKEFPCEGFGERTDYSGMTALIG